MTQLDVVVSSANQRTVAQLTYVKTCFCVSSGRFSKQILETAIVVRGSHLEDGESGLEVGDWRREDGDYGLDPSIDSDQKERQLRGVGGGTSVQTYQR